MTGPGKYDRNAPGVKKRRGKIGMGAPKKKPPVKPALGAKSIAGTAGHGKFRQVSRAESRENSASAKEQKEGRIAQRKITADEALAWKIEEERLTIKFAKDMSPRQRKKYAL